MDAFLILCLPLVDTGVEKSEMRAAALYEVSAAGGNTWAMFELGKLCLHGRGVEKDEKKAVHWLSEASSDGIDGATLELANCYRDGTGKDKKRNVIFP